MDVAARLRLRRANITIENLPHKLTREDLYQKVWDRPTVQVAAELGVSDVMIAKICRRMDIPKPEPGYWRKKETGKKVKTIPLPAATGATTLLVDINHTSDTILPPFFPEILAPIKIELPPENLIKSSPNLDDARPLIKKLHDRDPERPGIFKIIGYGVAS